MKTIRSMETQMEGFSQEIINRFDRQVVVEPNANRTVQQPMIRRKARVTS